MEKRLYNKLEQKLDEAGDAVMALLDVVEDNMTELHPYMDDVTTAYNLILDAKAQFNTEEQE